MDTRRRRTAKFANFFHAAIIALDIEWYGEWVPAGRRGRHHDEALALSRAAGGLNVDDEHFVEGSESCRRLGRRRRSSAWMREAAPRRPRRRRARVRPRRRAAERRVSRRRGGCEGDGYAQRGATQSVYGA